MAQITGLFRLGHDAEVRFTGNNEPVASLSLAFNYYDKGADKNRSSQWIEGVLWGKRAESLAPYLKKGGQVYCCIEDPHIETFEGKNGPGHKLVGKIVSIELAGGQNTGNSDSTSSQKPANKQSAPRNNTPADKPFDEDDIPF